MFRIFGPPGTGKTTRLLDMVDQYLTEGTPPSSIAFLAFTKKAASEAKERACERFKLDAEKDLPYFRTLHSLAYQCVGLRKDQMMNKERFKELATHVGVDLSTTQDLLTEESTAAVGTQHPILSLINLARLKKTSLNKMYDSSEIEYSRLEVSYLDTAYKDFKKQHDLYDFTDLLELFLEGGHHRCPFFKVCFLDEAQDLSPIQWDIAHLLNDKCERMYAAGDDDQAIYRWNGADVEQFIHLDGGSEILDQSYRIPGSVHTLAESVSNRIQYRYKKEYKARKDSGSVQYIPHIDELDMAHDSWLILAQARYMLDEPREVVRSNGHLFKYQNGARSISEKVSQAIYGYTALSKNKEISGSYVKAMYDYMSGNDKRIARGFKKPDVEDHLLYSYETLCKSCGLLCPNNLIWHEALDRLPTIDRAYVTAVLRRGEKINQDPRILLSTIHGAKGGEADNVVILTDLTWSAIKDLQTRPSAQDDLLRLFYVGITRTRKNLYLVEPEEIERSFLRL